MLINMKKILYFFGALAFALTSCSDEENSENPILPENYILPKKSVYTEGKDKFETVFVYDGNKIVSATSLTSKTVYTYTGDYITKREDFSDGKIISKEEYIYDDGKLGRIIYTNVSEGVTSVNSVFYSYDGNTIAYTYYHNDNDGNPIRGNEGVLTYSGGNLVKKRELGKTLSAVSEVTYEYDTKNNPYKNILGYNLLIGSTNLVNNITKSTSYLVYVDPVFGEMKNTFVFSYTYEYNDKGYPTKKVQSNSSNDIKFPTEFTY